MMKHKLTGYINYPGKGIITDEDVYQCLRKHSRLIDRLNPRKMVEMTLFSQNFLMGLFVTDGWDKDGNWTFYGKNGFCTLISDS